jgi:hypothetical protein
MLLQELEYSKVPYSFVFKNFIKHLDPKVCAYGQISPHQIDLEDILQPQKEEY